MTRAARSLAAMLAVQRNKVGISEPVRWHFAIRIAMALGIRGAERIAFLHASGFADGAEPAREEDAS